MTQPRRCPQCSAEIPPDAPAGLCPKCLLQAGFESQPSVAATEQSPAASGFVPPSLAEMAQKFPQLEIIELLGKGGMGAVYKARQPGLDRLVAIKILPPEVGQDPAFAERFTREARALARLNHPNIVAVFDFGNASGLYYFIMEFVDGVNLREAIRSGSISPKETLAIIPQICDALQFAHDEGIVHRDIKPENVLIDKRGRVKIADFGLAKLMGQELIERNLTGTHQVMGTLRYMAPEQMEGSHAVDHRADIYSLGVVFYELLTGEVPMGRFAPPSKKVQIDVRLDEIVLRALERAPEQRYQHASELKTSVDQVTATPGDSPGRAAPGRKSDLPPTAPDARLSWCALAGAIWASYFFMAAALAYPILNYGVESLWLVLAVVAGLIGVAAPFVTTILGFVAIGQIRRSVGKLYGLPLAAFDALLFPLLLLDGLVLVVVTAPTTLGLAMPTFGLRILYPALILVIGLPIIAWIDYRIARAVWRNVTGFEAPPKPAPVAAASSARQPSEMVRRLALIYLVLVSLFSISLVALQSGNLVGAGNASLRSTGPTEVVVVDNAALLDWSTRLTWGFGITSLACLAAWGYFVTQRPLTPRPRAWKYLLIAWAVVALPLAIWFVVWGLSSQAPRHDGETPRIISRTLIGLMAPYVAMALVWLIFGPTPEPSPAAAPKAARRPTYTRWVIVPMFVMFFLWLAGSVAAMAYYRMGAGEPNGPQQIMAWHALGLIILVVEFFALLLLRWMQTLSSATYWTLVKRLVLSVVSLVLAVAALLVYMMSPWNTRYIESHGLVFAPQSRAYLRLELPCHFASQSRSQAPYYAPDTFELRIEPFYGENLLHLMFVEWPGFKFRWNQEMGGQLREEPLDHQSPTGFIDHHDHFVAWWETDVHLDLKKLEIKQEVEELYQLLTGWDSEPPRQWDDFLAHARSTLTHYDFVKEYPAQNLITLKPTGFVLLYVLLGILIAFLAAIAASIFAARRQQKRSAQPSLPEPQAPSP